MKTEAEMRALFQAMPKKARDNPYWAYEKETDCICHKRRRTPVNRTSMSSVLDDIQAYFRQVYESFGTEAQVLIVSNDDAVHPAFYGLPVLCYGTFVHEPCTVFVLPQNNTPVNSCISETFWQNKIVANGIVPLARIHSHHILCAYQSATDYATLNSGTLEVVMGKILDKEPAIGFWLDIPGTKQKGIVFHQGADETPKRILPGNHRAGTSCRPKNDK